MEKEKIVSIEDRIPKLKQARKKKANRRLIFYLSIFFFLIAIIVYLQSPLSHVKSIIVTGNSFYPEDEVIEQSGIAKGTNIWTINKEEIIQTLENDPLIKNAEVETKLPWTVEIHLIEHERVGYIKKENEYYPVLGNGTVLEESKIKRLSGDAPLLLSFSQEDVLVEMSKELSNLPSNILNIISEIHWTPTDKNKNDITLYMTDGFMVQSSIRNFSEKMKVYPSIASQLEPGSEGIIHIGVGAYFEPFNQEITEEEIISTDGDE
ncbi:cell division protein FtsQ/DivIB [Ornithinibacillus sp. BX22]|uniref:Cell division protein DivIB n=1 Tax=Ornithinibacillus hominis TaxID=2763055 RepID=A0A923L3Q5_9BACI|nr:cell division protein FtsQ/DivIB [Ornithinibacillus hominis]MBC5635876.1 cell division protein FtsQ/DivIB [Ornithinibacillus hominis]